MLTPFIILAGFIFLFSILFEIMALHLVLPMLANSPAVRENYRQVLIPTGAGLTFPFTVMASYLLVYLSDAYGGGRFTLFLAAIVTLSFLGFIDDMLGQRGTLGFKGHFKSLFGRHELTTGGLKALGGGLVAVYVALLYSRDWKDFLLNVLVIAFFTNAMNLFDLRPGRCIKVFVPLFLVLAVFAWEDALIFLPVLGAVLSYAGYDFKARAMMGDAGSNVLGITLGVMCVYGLGVWARLGVLAVLVLLHVYTEKYSLTELIENNKVLRVLDKMGRNDPSD